MRRAAVCGNIFKRGGLGRTLARCYKAVRVEAPSLFIIVLHILFSFEYEDAVSIMRNLEGLPHAHKAVSSPHFKN